LVPGISRWCGAARILAAANSSMRLFLHHALYTALYLLLAGELHLLDICLVLS